MLIRLQISQILNTFKGNRSANQKQTYDHYLFRNFLKNLNVLLEL